MKNALSESIIERLESSKCLELKIINNALAWLYLLQYFSNWGIYHPGIWIVFQPLIFRNFFNFQRKHSLREKKRPSQHENDGEEMDEAAILKP